MLWLLVHIVPQSDTQRGTGLIKQLQSLASADLGKFLSCQPEEAVVFLNVLDKKNKKRTLKRLRLTANRLTSKQKNLNECSVVDVFEPPFW